MFVRQRRYSGHQQFATEADEPHASMSDDLGLTTVDLDDVLTSTTSDIVSDNLSTELSITSHNVSRQRDENLARVEVAVQCFIFAVTVLGNGLVLVALARHAASRTRRHQQPAARQAAAGNFGGGRRGGFPGSTPRRRRYHLSRMDFMILHLTLADLFVATFNVLPQLAWDAAGHFNGGDLLCRSVAFLQVVAMYGSSYVLTATAVDRYLAICHPLRSFIWSRPRFVRILIGGAWLTAGVLSVPQLVVWGYRLVDEKTGLHECWCVFDPPWTEKLYVTWSTLAIYVVPLFVITGAYGRICVVVWRSSLMARSLGCDDMLLGGGPRQQQQQQHLPDSESVHHRPDEARLLQRMTSETPATTSSDITSGCRSTESCRTTGTGSSYKSSGVVAATRRPVLAGGNHRPAAVSRAKVKTIKLTAAVVLSYLVCWCPFFVSQMLSVWVPNASFDGPVMTITSLLASLNSCINPWIYFVFIATTTRCHFCCCCCCCRRETLDNKSRDQQRLQLAAIDEPTSQLPPVKQ